MASPADEVKDETIQDEPIQTGPLRGLKPEEYGEIIEEAVHLRMIPYDLRVWHGYRFSSLRNHDAITILFEIYKELLVKQKLDAELIAQWCENGTFSIEARRKLYEREHKNFIDDHKGAFKKRKKEVLFDQKAGDAWSEQAKHCLLCSKCQESVQDPTLLEKRYPYLVFGMILRKTLGQDIYQYVWHHLGLATDEYSRGMGLFRQYSEVVNRYIAGTAASKEYEDHDAFTRKVFEKLSEVGLSAGDRSLYRDLARFLKNTPNKTGGSVWRLEHLLFSGLDWESAQNRPLFKKVTQNYGYDQLPLVTGPKEYIDEAGQNLREAYIAAFENDPFELQRACGEGKLHMYVSQVWGMTTGSALHPGTSKALEDVDRRNLVLPPSP